MIKAFLTAMNRKVLVLRWSVFVLMVLSTFFITDTHRTLFLKPFGTHTWRQSDSASQFRNFYQNGTALWKPQLMNQTGREGIAVAEFPITYYVAAQFAKVFGYSEAWCRGIHWLLFVTASLCLYLMALRFIDNPVIAVIPSLYFLNLPLYYFYGNNFLPNIPAISFAIIGWYYYFRFLYDGRSRALTWMLVFMTLGALIKASEAIHLLAAFLSLLFAHYVQKKKWPAGSSWRVWLGPILAMACVLGWVAYAKAANQIYGNNMSLLGILPYWEMSEVDRQYTWEVVIYTIWAPVIASSFNWKLLYLLGIGFLWPKVWRSAFLVPGLLLLLGSAAYGVLWYQAFMVHDYYLLTMLVCPFFFLMMVLEPLNEFVKKWQWLSALTMIALLYLGVQTMAYNGEIQKQRTQAKASEINSAFYTLEDRMRDLGVNRQDKIIAVPDPSPNISLYMANNPGWTDCLNGGINNPAPYIKAGAKYLLAIDTTVKSRPGMAPYLTDSMGGHGPFVIYRLPESPIE